MASIRAGAISFDPPPRQPAWAESGLRADSEGFCVEGVVCGDWRAMCPDSLPGMGSPG